MKLPLAIVSITMTAVTIAAIEIGTIVSEEVLEPSIQNEVDHALSREFDYSSLTGSVSHAEVRSSWTNGLDVTAKAIKLISLQKSDGRWMDGTNDVTRSVRKILQSL